MARTILSPQPTVFPDVMPAGPGAIPGGGYQRIEGATPAAFGGLIGAAEQQAGERVEAGGGALIGAAIQQQDLYNQITADKATTDYMHKVHLRMFGDPTAPEGDPARVGMLGLHGDAAMTAARNMPQLLDQDREQIAATLPNNYVRQLFQSESRRQRIYVDQQIGSHYEIEMQKWGQEQQNNRATVAAINAGLNHNNPDALNQSYTQASDAAVKEVTNALGGRPPRADNPDEQNMLSVALAKNYTMFAKNVVDAKLAQNDALGAQKFLNDWQPVMGLSGPVMDSFNNAIRPHLIKAEGDAAAARAISGAGGGAAVGSAPSGPVEPAKFTDEANKQGIDPRLVHATASIESDYGRNTGNKVSPSNTGIFQRAPANASGGQNDTYDNQIRLGVNDLVKERDGLAAALGRTPTNAEIYLAHQQGISGATKLIQNPSVPAGQLVPPVNISNNGGDPNQPASTFVQHWQQVYAHHEGRFIQVAAAAPLTVTDATAGPAPATPPTPGAPGVAGAIPPLAPILEEHQRALDQLNTQTFSTPEAQEHATRMVDQHFRGLEERNRALVEDEARNEHEAAKKLTDWQKQNEAELFAKAVRREPLDANALAYMVQNQQITPTGYNAVIAEAGRIEAGVDDYNTVLHLNQRIGRGEDVTQDIYAGVANGRIKGPTADTLMKANQERQKTTADQVERTAFATLRTIAGMDAQEHPMIDLGREAQQAQVALWGQAQTEWNQRVIVNKESPMTVLADMAPRYRHPVQSLEALPRPMLGPISKLEDIPSRVQAIDQAMFDHRLTPDQANRELQLTYQYQQIMEDEQRRDAVRKTIPPQSSGAGPRVLGVTRTPAAQ